MFLLLSFSINSFVFDILFRNIFLCCCFEVKVAGVKKNSDSLVDFSFFFLKWPDLEQCPTLDQPLDQLSWKPSRRSTLYRSFPNYSIQDSTRKAWPWQSDCVNRWHFWLGWRLLWYRLLLTELCWIQRNLVHSRNCHDLGVFLMPEIIWKPFFITCAFCTHKNW